MQFNEFYQNTQARLKDSILSLWATGDAEMQQYFSALLDREGLMAEPVFQTAFPWEPSSLTFAQTDSIFSKAFIKAMDAVRSEDFRFPKERHPYKHQVESWDALINRKKSIAVTTGTGSGKTECFMLPVLYDLFTNCRNQTGINAIFLYPLNALISSQKKRMDAWCKALNNIPYAVYNGATDETMVVSEERKKFPELVSRKQIRETPPQVLFTNPSMLEYVLVRNKDVPLLQNSRGSLRWILLDEAHTLTGSAAAEMALLIRRIVDAFEVDIHQLRFAITSATVGSGADSQERLKEFMSKLCGIPENTIEIITGGRVMTEVPEQPSFSVNNIKEVLDSSSPESFREVLQLRQQMLNVKGGILSSKIGKQFTSPNCSTTLQLIDKLSERQVDGKSILPVRGHFFVRGIGGVYVCTNPDCAEHAHTRPAGALGTMTTVAATACSCGWPMLELTACSSCGNQLLEADKIKKSNTDEYIKMVTAVAQDPFAIDSTDETGQEDEDDLSGTRTRFYFTRKFKNVRYENGHISFSVSETGKMIEGESFVYSVEEGNCQCPYCGENIKHPIHFRLSSSFINRILADIILEQTPTERKLTERMLWDGHKYISFTDSRQGTAKISALINQDSESGWLRSQVYHKLCEMQKEMEQSEPTASKDELIEIVRHLEDERDKTSIPLLRTSKQKEIDKYRSMMDGVDSGVLPANIGWANMTDYLFSLSDCKRLFDGNNPNDRNPGGKRRYLSAIMYDQFARRLPRERSLENLGMVSLVYPALQNHPLPDAARNLGITKEEWQSLLKIAADFGLRLPFHFFVNDEIKPYSTADIWSATIYNSNAEEIKVKKWPVFERKSRKPGRLTLLICAGLGYHDMEALDNEKIDSINDLLDTIWRTLKTKILKIDGKGYKLRLEEIIAFQLSKKLWLCPVKRRLLDAQFRGYSPWMKGVLTPDNIQHYKIENSIIFPGFPYPFNMDEEKNRNMEITRQWLSTHTQPLRNAGVWNNLHEQVILNRPLYLAGEHSAQQMEKRLKRLEQEFEDAEISILNCSTTMEMGVDIGGISAVIMNNVPPSPANYLQRAGRAGRRSEAKSLALTICAPNPIGTNAMTDPLWALNHQIAPPFLPFNSQPVVERHVHAFFLGKFVQTDAIRGLNVKEKVQSFFLTEEGSIAVQFQQWLSDLDVEIYANPLKAIVNKTPLQTKTHTYLLDCTINTFQVLIDKTNRRNNGFDKKLKELEKTFGAESPACKAVQYQKNQFFHKNAIGYMAQEAFLPSAGLPTGIVEFDTTNIDDLENKRTNTSRETERTDVAKPSHFITRALSEFAPSNEVVIDGRTYCSQGIMLQNERGDQISREYVQSCKNCGFQRITEEESDSSSGACPHCGQSNFTGLNFPNGKNPGLYTEVIQPAGFAVDIYERPHRRVRVASAAQYVDPLLLNLRPWATDNATVYECRESENDAEILFYNMGKGAGYSVCLHCGRVSTDEDGLVRHKRLRGGKREQNDNSSICDGNDNSYAIKRNIVLCGHFKTDFCEIRFRDETGQLFNSETLLYTLGAILTKEFAHYLAVEEAEIGFGIKNYDKFSTVFIYDTTKGGAGYAPQFALYANKLFASAKEKLSKCDCDKACTKCLIDRHTQWHMNKLDRNVALAWLEMALQNTVPLALSNAYPELKSVLGGVRSEINRLAYTNKLKQIWLYASSNVAAWEINENRFLENLKSKVKVHFVLDKSSHWSQQDRVSLIQLNAWAQLHEQAVIQQALLQPICQIETTDGTFTEYLGFSFSNTFDKNWGNTPDGNAYKKLYKLPDNLLPLQITIDEQTMAKTVIDDSDPHIINSNELAGIILRKLNGNLGLEKAMRNQSFDVVYSDRYLKSPIGCIIMIQFLQAMQNLLGFSIRHFTFNGQNFKEDYTSISKTYRTGEERNNAIEEMARQIGISNVETLLETVPHYRFLQFSNEQLRITIQPDGGIEHGWFLINQQLGNRRTNVDINNVYRISKKSRNEILYTFSIEHLQTE